MGEERVSRRQFIRLGGAVGAGVVGASVLAACGGESGQANGQTTSGSREETTAAGGGTTRASTQPSTTSPTVEQGGVIVQQEFLPPNMAFPFNVASQNGPQPAVLIHMEDGSWIAYSAVCTHAGCEVAYQLQDQQLGCPCHGSIFDPTNGGSVVQGPAEQPLQEIQVEASGGNVMLV
ncbi:MAG: ubiquinol-cytochrome c reductase iron-sulfur subunit [Rubrobacteraceae bacterium]